MAQNTLVTLIEKTADWDKDERYMATSDLCMELQKDAKLDPALERKICQAVLARLDDKTNDVQSIAVKCLGVLLKKVQEQQVLEIADRLCSLILDKGKTELRDIYSIGLKTLIADVPETMGGAVAHKLTPKLSQGVQQDEFQDMKLEVLDNLTDLLKRFGRELENEHEALLALLLAQLSKDKPVVRKRATSCAGALAVVISDALLNHLLEHLLKQIQVEQRPDIVRTYIQTIGTVSRTVGYRLGRHLDAVVPLFLKFCGDPDDESLHTEAANELRENCFQGFESFVIRCPREVTPHLRTIVRASLRFVKYDPNYNYGDSDEEEDDGMEQDDQEDYEEEDFGGGGSDDDDTSWKVRRSALKVIAAVIACRPEMLQDMYNMCADELVRRFKEREENVRLDVVNCLNSLLGATMSAEGRRQQSDSLLLQHQQFHHLQPAAATQASEQPQLMRQRSAVHTLQEKLPAIVKASEAQLKNLKSPKTVSAVFQMLRTLCMALHGGLEAHMQTLLNSVHQCLHTNSKQGDNKAKELTLKLEALLFLRLMMEKHPPEVFQPHADRTVELVAQCVREEWYKIIAEALRCVGATVRVLRPRDKQTGQFVGNFDSRRYAQPLYQAVYPRLSAHDIDQEIKECAISATGLLLAHMGSELGPQLPEVLALLMDRLRNEITRMATLKTLAMVSTSPLNIDLSSILPDAVQELALFLRQQSRPLKQAALEALLALVSSNAGRMRPEQFALVLREAAPLVSDSDLHLAHLSLRVITSIVQVAPATAPATQQEILPRALTLAASPLLQGLALTSLMGLFQAVVASNAPGLGSKDLLGKLKLMVEQGGERLAKQAIANIAKCMAALCAQADEASRAQTVAAFVQDMRGRDETRKHLALLVVGELGRQTDLSRVQDLQAIILGTFESGLEETKTAAAYALGHIAVGNMRSYLPVVLDNLEQSRHQYLILSALKEIIVCHAQMPGKDFGPYVEQVLPHLEKHCESPEEGVRNMVAECLGALAGMHPQQIIPALLSRRSGTPLARWTVATSLKYLVAGGASMGPLTPHIGTFLSALQDEDLDVRRAGLLMANAAVHHQPHLVADLLPTHIIPVLYSTVDLRMERSVDLGPFKHKVDDAEGLRKASLACIDTVLDTVPEKMDVGALMPHLAKGLGDPKPDVQMMCHQVLGKLCEYSPGTVLGSLDMLIDPLDKTCNRAKKDKPVSTEVERANDLTRSTLRAVVAISRIPDVEVSRKFSDFMDRIQRKEDLGKWLDSIRKEQSLLIA